jgi:hypothetical protein
MATRTMQTMPTKPWCRTPTASALALRHMRHWLPRAMALAITPLMLGSCAEFGELRTDITRLRSNLNTNTEALSQLSSRVDALERRQAATDNAAKQAQQELTQAIEVLLKKALVTENRLTTLESVRSQSRGAERSDRQVRQLPSDPSSPAPQAASSAPEGKRLSLGMTQEDVRRTLGDPISIENAGSYVFWQYSQLSNQKYVVFEKSTGQVSGWRGF